MIYFHDIAEFKHINVLLLLNNTQPIHHSYDPVYLPLCLTDKMKNPADLVFHLLHLWMVGHRISSLGCMEQH